MDEPSLFLSSCSRRQWARRRSRLAVAPLVVPGLVVLSCVLALMVVLLAIGHGSL